MIGLYIGDKSGKTFFVLFGHKLIIYRNQRSPQLRAFSILIVKKIIRLRLNYGNRIFYTYQHFSFPYLIRSTHSLFELYTNIQV